MVCVLQLPCGTRKYEHKVVIQNVHHRHGHAEAQCKHQAPNCQTLPGMKRPAFSFLSVPFRFFIAVFCSLLTSYLCFHNRKFRFTRRMNFQRFPVYHIICSATAYDRCREKSHRWAETQRWDLDIKFDNLLLRPVWNVEPIYAGNRHASNLCRSTSSANRPSNARSCS